MYVPTGFFMISQVLREQTQEFRLSNRTIQNLGGVARLTINEYGRVFIEQASGVTEIYEQWAAYKEDNLGHGFEARMTQNSGALTSGILGVWTKIEEELSWIVDFDEGGTEFEGLLEIRPVVNGIPGDNVASAIFTLIVGEAPPEVAKSVILFQREPDELINVLTLTYETEGGWDLSADVLTLSVDGSGFYEVHPVTATSILIADYLGGTFQFYNLVEDTWTAGISTTAPPIASFDVLSTTKIVGFNFNEDLVTYSLVEGDWEETDTPLSVTGIWTFCVLSSTEIAVVVSDSGPKLRLYRLTGGTWSLVGSQVAMTGNPHGISALSSTDIVYAAQTGAVTRYRHNGTTWSQIGSAISAGDGNWYAASAVGSNELVAIAYDDAAENYGLVQGFKDADNDGTWLTEGLENRLGVSADIILSGNGGYQFYSLSHLPYENE